MANPEHLEILKKGVEVWNKWREENPDVIPQLSRASLHGIELIGANLEQANMLEADLSEVKLSWANLVEANLSKANICMAKLIRADLSRADIAKANLSRADLNHADLNLADLYWTDLSGADLRANFSNANLSKANLNMANLSKASLFGVNFNMADLTKANLTKANLHRATFKNSILDGTIFTKINISGAVFVGVDLSSIIGLETLRHMGPSSVGIDTIVLSAGRIPKAFLRGCGVPDTFIQYMASLKRNTLEYYSCFISYSSNDNDFAEQLYADLQNKGVRCWFAPEDMKTGDKIRDRIDQSIRIHDKLLLILSEHSINSVWVEDEVEAAYEQERRRGKTVLFPIRLDSAVMDTDKAWASNLRRSRHIGDFTQWKNHDAYQKAFDRLMRDLKAEKPASTD